MFKINCLDGDATWQHFWGPMFDYTFFLICLNKWALTILRLCDVIFEFWVCVVSKIKLLQFLVEKVFFAASKRFSRWTVVFLNLWPGKQRFFQNFLVPIIALYFLQFSFIFEFCECPKFIKNMFHFIVHFQNWHLVLIFQKCETIFIFRIEIFSHLKNNFWDEIRFHLKIFSLIFCFYIVVKTVKVAVSHNEFVVWMDSNLFDIVHKPFTLQNVQMYLFCKLSICVIKVLKIGHNRFNKGRIQFLKFNINFFFFTFKNLFNSQAYIIRLYSSNFSEKLNVFTNMLVKFQNVDFAEKIIQNVHFFDKGFLLKNCFNIIHKNHIEWYVLLIKVFLVSAFSYIWIQILSWSLYNNLIFVANLGYIHHCLIIFRIQNLGYFYLVAGAQTIFLLKCFFYRQNEFSLWIIFLIFQFIPNHYGQFAFINQVLATTAEDAGHELIFIFLLLLCFYGHHLLVKLLFNFL